MLKTDDIYIQKTGKAGRITLTRPEALNALTYEMCNAIGAALNEWQNDNSVAVVIIDAEGSRSFCAGGDIADMYKSGKAGDYDYGRRFWTDEYRVNAAIKNYPKPYIAIMDGIVMGGGVGISAHGSHRIVTENTMFAMPECGIGLVPDVGGNLLLGHAPGHVGEYLGTTGARLGAADCLYAGIGDFFINEEALPSLISKLEETGDASEILNFQATPTNGNLENDQSEIDKHFSLPNAIEIIKSLEASDSDFATNASKLMRRNCPLAVSAAVELVRSARQAKSIEDVLKEEFRYTTRSLADGNFIEGIRAQIIDKDRQPKWKPVTLEEVSNQSIMDMLAPLGDNELTFEEVSK